MLKGVGEESNPTHYRMFKLDIQRGRSEVREATNKEPHVCGRARDGEHPVS